MIKFIIDEENKVFEMEVEGNLTTIVSNISNLVHLTHLEISSQSYMAGRMFERILKRPDFWDMTFAIQENDSKILSGLREGDKE